MLNEPGSVQSDPKELASRLSEIWPSKPLEELPDITTHVQVMDHPQEDPPKATDASSDCPTESPRVNSEPIILPSLSTEKNPTPESGNMKSFVQEFVSNFLEQSLAEYLHSVNQSPPTNTPNLTTPNQQFIPLYIQDLLHTVLQNYLTENVLKVEHSFSEIHRPPSPKPEAVPLLEVFVEEPIHSKRFAEMVSSYEERISNYEERLKELESNYHQLQKSSQETISSQSLKLLTLGELLEEKNDELMTLRSEQEKQKQKEQEGRQEAMEKMSLLSEELCGGGPECKEE